MEASITNISKIVHSLIKKFNTNDPFKLADYLGYVVICKPLGEIKGCYKYISRRRVIFINSELEYYEKIVVCAHELGHAIMHPRVNCSFIQNYTLLSIKKIEIEANKFCAHLLLTNDILYEYQGYTYEQISQATLIPVEIIKLRQAQMKI